ncbi:MAG: hypothetical protein LBU28_10930 [Spirochaetaceae bacterium]|jgi:myosin heavy subunit|nr:hypothetical protein [Spirochaetaceae bacterium]
MSDVQEHKSPVLSFEEFQAELQEMSRRMDRWFEEQARRSEEQAKEQARRSAELDRWFEEQAKERARWSEEQAKEQARRSEEQARRSAELDRWFEEQAKERARRSEEEARRSAELAKEEARRSEEEAKERARWSAELAKEEARRSAALNRQFAETDRKISKLGGRLGELVENLVASNLSEKFKDWRFFFNRTSLDVVFKNPDGTFLAEIDILLENGSTALMVEVKSKLTIDDVKEHLERIGKLRRYADEHGDARKFLGAVAGGIIPEDVKPFAIKNGLFVIEQSGETSVIAVPDGFVPRSW